VSGNIRLFQGRREIKGFRGRKALQEQIAQSPARKVLKVLRARQAQPARCQDHKDPKETPEPQEPTVPCQVHKVPKAIQVRREIPEAKVHKVPKEFKAHLEPIARFQAPKAKRETPGTRAFRGCKDRQARTAPYQAHKEAQAPKGFRAFRVSKVFKGRKVHQARATPSRSTL
jgi:hypothetical protein